MLLAYLNRETIKQTATDSWKICKDWAFFDLFYRDEVFVS